MDEAVIIEKLRTGHQLNSRGTGWWLSGQQRASGAADAESGADDLVNALDADGTLRIVMLTQSMRAELTK